MTDRTELDGHSLGDTHPFPAVDASEDADQVATPVAQLRPARKKSGSRSTEATRIARAASASGEAYSRESPTPPSPLSRTLSGDDQAHGDAHGTFVIVGEQEGHSASVTHDASADLLPIIADIKLRWRQRQTAHRSEKSLTLQAKGLCRYIVGGDKKEADKLFKAALGKGEHELAHVAAGAIIPFINTRAVIETERKRLEKELAKLAKQLPIEAWWSSHRGMNAGGLAGLIGEAGDLGIYSNPAKLWKRMGLAVVDGGRQRRVTGDAALEHGYSPDRRALVWVIGQAIIMQKGPYYDLFIERREYELARTDDNKPKSKAHACARAKRYMEKRILLHVWREWGQAGASLTPNRAVACLALQEAA